MWLDLGLGCLKKRGGDGRQGQRGKQEPGSDGLVSQISFGLEDLGSILRMEVSREDKRYKVREKVGYVIQSTSGRTVLKSVLHMFWNVI